MTDTSPLDGIIAGITAHLGAKNAAREQALVASRTIIRMSANSIRAVHRGEFERAASLLDEARVVRDGAVAALAGHGDVYHAGFLHDAQKEYAEARTTLALLSGGVIPSPESLGVVAPAYLNGIAEAVGEMRRMILDRLRSGEYGGILEKTRGDLTMAIVQRDAAARLTR
jgi:translin